MLLWRLQMIEVNDYLYEQLLQERKRVTGLLQINRELTFYINPDKVDINSYHKKMDFYETETVRDQLKLLERDPKAYFRAKGKDYCPQPHIIIKEHQKLRDILLTQTGVKTPISKKISVYITENLPNHFKNKKEICQLLHIGHSRFDNLKSRVKCNDKIEINYRCKYYNINSFRAEHIKDIEKYERNKKHLKRISGGKS